MKLKTTGPPPWARFLLSRFSDPDTSEELEGDLAEMYAYWQQTSTLTQARWKYIFSVLRLLRPFAKKKDRHHYPKTYLFSPAMIRNYFKIAFRNLVKNKTYSAINIGGLAIGLACCLTIGLFIWDEISYDRFHTHGKSIYRVVEKQEQAGTIYDVAVTPGLLAPALKTDFAEIQQTCRLGSKSSGILQNGQTTIESDAVMMSDNSIFRLFDFKLEKGDARKALLKPDEVVISESMAERIFGKAWRYSGNLLGQPIKLNNKRTLMLAGVAKNPPINSHIQFDVLLSLSYDELQPDRFDWSSNNYHTYIQLNSNANASLIGQKLVKYIQKFRPKSKTTLSFQPLFDIYLHSDFAFQTDWSKTSNIVYTRIFAAVGLIVLLIAIFNFINLATARAIQRAREVGVRKAIGAFRRQLVTQFLGESLLMTLLAVAIALILLQAFLPLMNNIAAKSIAVPFGNPYFGLAIVGFVLLVSLLAGIYPAFYLSGFQPVKVLKGVFNVSSGQLFRRTLVVGQFMFSIILIIGAIVIYKQLTFLQNKNLGFEQSQLLVVTMKNELRQKSMLLKTDLQKQSSIVSVSAASTRFIDVINSTSSIKWDGQEPDDNFLITQANIDPDFLTTMGMKLIAGRNFDTSMATDSASAYLINETAAKRMGWTPEQAIGKTVTLWQNEGKVIGVVKDFHFRPLTATIEPFLFHYWPRESYSKLFVKTNPNKVREAISDIEQFYRKYEKQTAPEYEFLNQALESQYRTEQRTSRIVLYFSLLAIFVSCLGLFGLTTFSAEQRTKEIGIRKVLGASVNNIVTLFSQDFIKLVIIAIVFGCPIAWYSMTEWLQDFAYRIDIQWWIFLLAGCITVAIALLTVSFQAIKTALTDPVRSLRSE